jgi:hypothetical protein
MAANEDDPKIGMVPRYERKQTGPNDPEYGPYKPRNKGAEFFNPDMAAGNYKNGSRPEKRQMFEFKATSNDTPVPYDLLMQATDLYKASTIVREMGAGTTLIQMLKIYEKNIAVSENAFSRMYKDRPSTHEPDVAERERVAAEMHEERRQAREFLDYIKEGMQNHGLLSEYEINYFNQSIHPSNFRRGR